MIKVSAAQFWAWISPIATSPPPEHYRSAVRPAVARSDALTNSHNLSLNCRRNRGANRYGSIKFPTKLAHTLRGSREGERVLGVVWPRAQLPRMLALVATDQTTSKQTSNKPARGCGAHAIGSPPEVWKSQQS